MSGGGGPNVPQPSQQELDLITQATELLKQQQAEVERSRGLQEQFLPLMFREAGFEPTFEQLAVVPGRKELRAERDALKAFIAGTGPAPPSISGVKGGTTTTTTAGGGIADREGGRGTGGGLPQTKTTTTKSKAAQIEAANKRLREISKEIRGLKQTGVEQGALTGLKKREDPLAKQRAAIEKKFTERTLAALEGRLPVDPGLISQLRESEIALSDQLRRQLGPGFATSTPGLEALAEFQQRKSETLDAARRGDLTLGQQGQLGALSSNQAMIDQLLSRGGAIAGGPLALAGAFGAAGAGISNPLAALQNQRNLQLQANIAGGQQQAGIFSSLGQGVGSALPFLFL